MPGGKPARAPDAVLARPLSLASYPVATGRPRPAAPSRTREADRRANRGGRKSINLNSDPGGPSRSSSIAPAETILAAADSSAPTRQGLRDKEPARNAGVKARPSPRCCFGATPLVGELPRSNGQTTAWPAAPSRALRVIDKVNAGATLCCFGATPLVGELPRSNGQTTAWPAAPSRALRVIDKVNAGATLCCFGATPLVGELPRSNGQTTAWPAAPSRALRVIDKVNAGATLCSFGATPLVGELPRSNGQTTAWPAAPSRALRVIDKVNAGARKSINLNPGGPSRSSSIAPPKPYFAAPASSAPTRQGIKRTSPKNAGVKARPSPRCCFGATPLVGELPRSNGQTTACPSAPSRA